MLPYKENQLKIFSAGVSVLCLMGLFSFSSVLAQTTDTSNAISYIAFADEINHNVKQQSNKNKWDLVKIFNNKNTVASINGDTIARVKNIKHPKLAKIVNLTARTNVSRSNIFLETSSIKSEPPALKPNPRINTQQANFLLGEEDLGKNIKEQAQQQTEQKKREEQQKQQEAQKRQIVEQQARGAQQQATQLTANNQTTENTAQLDENDKGSQIANYALQFAGKTPYVFGGTSLTSGADCSGFVMAIFAHFGISLPHYSGSQALMGTPVSYANARPGDIVANGQHAAIYLGNGKVINVLNPYEGTRVTGLNVFWGGYSIRRIV